MCCLFGLYDYGGMLSVKQKNRIVSALAVASEVRGTDATGIAYRNGTHLCIYKRPFPARWMRFRIPAEAPGCIFFKKNLFFLFFPLDNNMFILYY